jgi:hypothetical protein
MSPTQQVTPPRPGSTGTAAPTGFDSIPTTDAPPPQARPSAVVARLRGYRPNRRAVLRALVIGATAATLVPLDWYLARREAAAAPSGRSNRSEYGTCHPEQYDAEPNNWPEGGEGVCYGGWKRGTYPCDGGYHREGRFQDGDTEYYSTRLTTNCSGRNAWRWKGYRCSDAITTVTFADGSEYTGVTMAACALTSQELANPLPVEPDDPYDDDTDDRGNRRPGRTP